MNGARSEKGGRPKGRSAVRLVALAAASAMAGAVVWCFAPGAASPPAAAATAAPAPTCDPADPPSCDAAGQAVEAKDPATAAGFYARACAARVARACTHQGALEEQSDRPKDALESYGAACDAGDLLGCTKLASLYERGKDWRIVKDYGKAIALFTRACDGGEGEGCVGLAEMREHGHGMAQNDLKVTALYVKGCEAKDARACFRLAERYRDARGARRNEAKAQELFARACGAGVAEACAAETAQPAGVTSPR